MGAFILCHLLFLSMLSLENDLALSVSFSACKIPIPQIKRQAAIFVSCLPAD